MKKKVFNYIFAVIGILLVITGLYFLKTGSELQNFTRALPGICVGFGCGLFGHGLGEIVSRKALKSNLEIKRKMDIEMNDERNIAISNCAKRKAFDVMTFVFGALIMSFSFMEVDIVAILLLVFAYLFVQGYAIYYSCKLNKEM